MHLDGQAKKLVEGLGCDGKGYAIALQSLKKRFGYRSLVARSVMEEVTKGEIIPPNNRQALSNFHTAIRDSIFTLNQMNFTSGLFVSDNLRLAISRLPQQLRHSWARKARKIRTSEEPTLIHFESWLSAEVEAYYDPDLPPETPSREVRKKADTKSNTTPVTRFTTLATKSEVARESQRQPVTLCPICTAPNHISRCWSYKNKSSADKMSVVKERKLCINCLRPGHLAQKCSSKFSCRVTDCGRRHHTTLHDAPRITSVGPNAPYDQREPESSSSCAVPSSVSVTATRLTSNQKSPTRVFIQMVPVCFNNSEGVSVETFALLDPCAGATLVRQDLAKRLGLRGPKKDLSIGTVLSDG